jgi:hypothetical protein
MGYELDNAWSPWERIVRAADNGTGLHLSAREIAQLGQDGAISKKAQNDSEERVNCECGLPIPAHRNSKCRKPIHASPSE